MRVSIFCSPEDSEASLTLLDTFRETGIDASVLKVRGDWESLSFKELQGYVDQATHYLVVWSARSRNESWLSFAVGYSIGRGFHTALYRADPGFPVSGYLSGLPILDSPEELSTFYIVERSLFLAENERDQARRDLYDMGLSYSVEGMADCVKEGNLRAVQLFIQTGMSADARDRRGIPMICLAARARHRRMLGYLLERGANVNAQGEDRGNTALMDAAACGASDIVSDLLASRADPNLASKEGQTALIIAVGRGDDVAAGNLLKAGADPDISDKLGFSARKYASLFNNPKIKELLGS